MSIVQTYSFTVTSADVLYVTQQIKRDMQSLRQAYPGLIDADYILDLHDAFATFLINDAVSTIALAIEDPLQGHLVFHELRYTISHTGSGLRSGTGGAAVAPRRIPASARFYPWVSWSTSMRSKPRDGQAQIVSGTGWNVPGQGPFNLTYTDGSWVDRSGYSSGPLVASIREYRR
jgi:hypothetical protein